MKRLSLALPLVVTVACFVGPGCDDTRPVVNIPAGGQGHAGEPASGGAVDPGTAGAGATAHAGAGGAAPECPADLFSAEGEDCSGFGEGFICSDGGTDPCELGNSIVCTGGTWERREAFPAPCGGASAGGAGGQADAGAPALGGAGGQGGAG